MHTKTPCTFFAVRRLSRQITQVYDRHLVAVGLRITQYSLLAHLRTQPGIAMGDLAARMGMDRSTLTRNLRPLVDAGWVATARTRDARSVQVELTEAGRAMLSRARPAWRAAQASLGELLGEPLARALHASAESASARLDARDEALPA